MTAGGIDVHPRRLGDRQKVLVLVNDLEIAGAPARRLEPSLDVGRVETHHRLLTDPQAEPGAQTTDLSTLRILVRQHLHLAVLDRPPERRPRAPGQPARQKFVEPRPAVGRPDLEPPLLERQAQIALAARQRSSDEAAGGGHIPRILGAGMPYPGGALRHV